MRHAWLQAAGLGVRQEVFGSGLRAGIEAELVHVVQHVVAHRDRAFVDAEDFLEVLTQHDFGDVLLTGRSACVLLLEHGQRVDVVGERLVGARERYALVVLAGDFLGGGPFGLGPVTHDLHAGLAVDDLGRFEVPVLAFAVRVHVGRDFLQLGERLDHFRAGQRFVVEIDQGFLVAIHAHDREHHGFEHGAVLPRLTAVGERDEASGFQLVAGCVELFEGGWILGDAGFLEDFRIDPQPVHAVNVHRHGHIITVVLHGIGDFLVEQAVPLFRLGDVFQNVGVEQTGRRPFLDVWAFDLRYAWRVTGDGAAFQHGHGSRTATTGDSTVLPGETVFFDLGLEHIDSGFFATGSPPVHDFHRTFGFGSGDTERQDCEREQGGDRNDSSEARNRIHSRCTFLVVMHCKSGACAARSLNRAFRFAGNEGTRKCHDMVTQQQAGTTAPKPWPCLAPAAIAESAQPARRDTDRACPARYRHSAHSAD